jgi:DNA-binding XRE family transcriptional regulator
MKEFDEIKMLKEFKAKSGWSNQRIGEAMGIHGQTIQGWLTGKYKPSPVFKKMLRSFLIEHL